jgi:hypothetical protein
MRILQWSVEGRWYSASLLNGSPRFRKRWGRSLKNNCCWCGRKSKARWRARWLAGSRLRCDRRHPRPKGRTLRCRDWKSSRHVVGYVAAHRGGALEGWLVAAKAIRRFEEVVVADMAGGAGRGRRGHVRPG